MAGIFAAFTKDWTGPGYPPSRVLHGLIPDVNEVAEGGGQEVEGVPGLVLETGLGALLLRIYDDKLRVVSLGLLQTCGVMRVKMLGIKILFNCVVMTSPSPVAINKMRYNKSYDDSVKLKRTEMDPFRLG